MQPNHSSDAMFVLIGIDGDVGAGLGGILFAQLLGVCDLVILFWVFKQQRRLQKPRTACILCSTYVEYARVASILGVLELV